jgi:hypothetical protein
MTDLLASLDTPQPGELDWRRDRWGRPLVRPEGGGKPVAYTRPTTLAKAISDMEGLSKWRVRMAAKGLAMRKDLLAMVASHHDDKRELDRLCEEAQEAASASEGRNLGTALHRFTERLDRGEEVAAPAPWDADLDAYAMTLNGAGIVRFRSWVEVPLVCDAVKAAGTADRLVMHDGRHYIADIKTGGYLAWGDYAMQLAIYANSVPYDLANDVRLAWPGDVDLERALIVHLPAGTGTCDLYWIDIAAGWRAVKAALWVREWRKRNDLAVKLP